MYGLWLFKELRTEYGFCKVEVWRKNYTASAIEIGALVGNSLNLALENLDTITAPIGKSVCSFEIYDTDQVEYDELFTPDATAYKVVISTKLDGGNYNTRWSGYVTPDFFAENLSFRTPISISARDNIGYLNDVDFDMEDATTTVRGLIQAAFKRIAEDYPMQLVFATQKQTAEGVLAVDATISTMLFRDGSWYEAIETILHDLGLQMRWVDNNTIAVIDVSQIPEYYGKQDFNFIGKSGYREILPAWRELSQEQDFGLRENFFEGWFDSNKLDFVESKSLTVPDLDFRQDVRYYRPTNWGVANNIYTTDPSFYNTSFGEKIIFSAVSKDNPATTYMSWQANILKSSVPLTIKFNALNSVVYPFGGYTPYPLQLKVYDPFVAFGSVPGDFLQIGLRMNLFLYTKDNKIYRMDRDWVEDDGTGSGQYINFTLDKVSLDSYNEIKGEGAFPIGNRPKETELSIIANTIPYDGVLELRIYGYFIEDYNFNGENRPSGYEHFANFDKFFTHINSLTYTFESDDISTGQDAVVEVGVLHNVKEKKDYTFGQVAYNCGGINAYAGGLFDAEGRELIGFQRNASATNYNLLELVGREVIHFNKKNYNKLSGTIRNLDKEPLMFNRLFTYNGKNYAPFAYSLDVISNTMNITTMQEVEPYVTADLAAINSAVTTGGATVGGGGNNTILQYSQDAGNTKRIYELTAASEEEKKDAWLMLDNISFPEARKVNVKDLVGLDENKLIIFLDENNYTTEQWVNKAIDPLETAIAANADNIIAINNRVSTLEALGLELKGDAQSGFYIKSRYSFVTEGEVISGRRASGATTDVGGGGLNVNAMWEQLGLYDNTKVIDASHIPAEFITETELSNKGFATTAWVNDNYLGLGGGTINGFLDFGDNLRIGYYGSALGVHTPYGWSYFGMQNSSWCHIYSDAPAFYMNKPLYVNDGYEVYHTGNFTPSDYLPKSGGTIVGALQLSDKGELWFGGNGEPYLKNLSNSNYINVGSSGLYWNNTNLFLTDANYYNYALPLSGGVLKSGAVGVLHIESSNADRSALYFLNGSSQGGYFGVDGNGSFFITDTNWNVYHNLIHSGNIGSQSVANADTLDSLHASDFARSRGSDLLLTDINHLGYGGQYNNWPYYGPAIVFGVSTYYARIQKASDSNRLSVNSYVDGVGDTNWQSIAFLDDNVASAQNLTHSNGTVGATVTSGGIIQVSSHIYMANDKAILMKNSAGTYVYAMFVDAYNDMYIGYNSVNRVIFNSGNVLIGTTTDNGNKLQVNGYIQVGISADASIGYMSGQGYLSLGTPNDEIRISGKKNDVMYVNYAKSHLGYAPTEWRWYKGDNGASYAAFRIGELYVYGSLTGTGDIVTLGEVISSRRASASDARLKDNITTLTADNCLNIARQLRPTEWNWKTDGKHSFGFIAQDVNNILPCAVTAIKDAELGERLNLQYDQLIAIAIGGVQGVDDKVTRLENEVQDFKKEVKVLKEKLQKYELRYGYN